MTGVIETGTFARHAADVELEAGDPFRPGRARRAALSSEIAQLRSTAHLRAYSQCSILCTI
jgi:hypothetical protein